MSTNTKGAYRVYTSVNDKPRNNNQSGKSNSKGKGKSNSKGKGKSKAADEEKRPGWIKFIIALEIIGIIVCLLTPSIVYREDRKNKKHDIEAVQEFGDELRKTISDDDGLSIYINKAASYIRNKKVGSKNAYRVIGYMEANNSTPTYYYVSITVGDKATDYIGNMGMRSKFRNMNSEYDFQMLFENGIFMNQWIFCVDGKGQLYIFAGGGCSPITTFIDEDSCLVGDRKNKVYQVYPSVDKTYKKLVKDDLQGYRF